MPHPTKRIYGLGILRRIPDTVNGYDHSFNLTNENYIGDVSAIWLKELIPRKLEKYVEIKRLFCNAMRSILSHRDSEIAVIGDWTTGRAIGARGFHQSTKLPKQLSSTRQRTIAGGLHEKSGALFFMLALYLLGFGGLMQTSVSAKLVESQGVMKITSYTRQGKPRTSRNILFSVRVSTEDRQWWIKTTDPIGSKFRDKGSRYTAVGFDGQDSFQYYSFSLEVVERLAKESGRTNLEKFTELGRINERDYPLATTQFEQALWYAFTGFDYFRAHPTTNQVRGILPGDVGLLFWVKTTNVADKVRIRLLYPKDHKTWAADKKTLVDFPIPNAEEAHGLVATEILAENITKEGRALIPDKFTSSHYGLNLWAVTPTNVPTYLEMRIWGTVTNKIIHELPDASLILPKITGQTHVRDYRYLPRGGQSYVIESNSWPTRATAPNILKSLIEQHALVKNELSKKSTWGMPLMILFNLFGISFFFLVYNKLKKTNRN